jgi:hypothetical protein
MNKKDLEDLGTKLRPGWTLSLRNGELVTVDGFKDLAYLLARVRRQASKFSWGYSKDIRREAVRRIMSPENLQKQNGCLVESVLWDVHDFILDVWLDRGCPREEL